MDDVITLVSRTQSQDEFGVWQSILTENEVLCQVHSITRQEFFEAGRSGLNPSYLFTIFAGDYSGESIVHCCCDTARRIPASRKGQQKNAGLDTYPSLRFHGIYKYYASFRPFSAPSCRAFPDP